MKQIYQLLGLGSPLLDGDLGIEIECEGAHLRVADEDNSKYWKTVNDGSLRGVYPDSCAEFVLRRPIKAKDAKAAIQELIAIQTDAKLAFSFRTSVHVHVNIQELTEVQLLNLVYTYLLLEEPLLNYCGKERKGNRFCLRLSDAEGSLEYITAWIAKSFDSLRLMAEGTIRYSSINLAAVRKYGSVEFRGMRGTIDIGTLTNWCTALLRIRAFAMASKDPSFVYETFCNMGAIGFLNHVLGDVAPVYVYPQVEEGMSKSFSLSIDIPAIFNRYKDRFKEKVAPPEEEDEFRIPDNVMEELRRAGAVAERFRAAARPAPRIKLPPRVVIDDLV